MGPHPSAAAAATLGICLVALSPALEAQSPSWSPGFAAPGLPGKRPTHVVYADLGAGELLYIAAESPPTPLHIFSWDGARLEPVFVAPGASTTCSALTVGDDGGGIALFAAVRIAGTSTQLWRIDGAGAALTGVAVGLSFPGPVADLEFIDLGLGPVLHACGSLTSISGQPADRIASWNGTSWSAVGAGLPAPVGSLEPFDSGAGLQLHAGLDWTGSGFTSAVVRWDGASWIACDGSVTGRIDGGLESFDFGAGPVLLAGGAIFSGPTSSGLGVWNGSSWSLIASQTTIVYDIARADFGAGTQCFLGSFAPSPLAIFDGTTSLPLPGPVPNQELEQIAVGAPGGVTRIAAAGSFSTIGNLRAAAIATWDGAWHALGHGFEGAVNALAVADFGAGPVLHAAGTLFVTGVGVPRRVAARSGPGFAPLTEPFGQGFDVFELGAADLGAGTQLFAAGNFLAVHGAANTAGLGAWNGSTWSGVGGSLHGEGYALRAHDDGAGLRLFAGGNFNQGAGGPGNRIAAWNGSAWDALGGGMDGLVTALAVHDEGGGAQLYAGGTFLNAGGAPAARIARWDGASWSPLGSGVNNQVLALASFDDGAGAMLYAGGTFTVAGGTPVSFLARWNGTSWSDVPGGGSNGAILALHVHDDGRGPALYVGGGFGTLGGITAYNIARFDGTTWEAVDGGFDGVVRDLASVDDDGDGDAELFAGGGFTATASVASGRIARLEGRPHYTSFCFGDGTLADHTTACPCGNDGAAGHGCANPFDASGALLGASGSTNPDTLELAGSNMPLSAFGIYLQHDALDDRVFHDGVICAGGNLIRLRNRSAVGGSSTYPNSTDTQTVSQRGLVTPGSGATRYYSLFYRSASPTFCPPATANVTNGLRVIW